MKLVSFKRAGRTSWGIAADGGVVDVGGRLSGRFPTMRSALEADAIALIAQDAKGAEVDLPWSAIALLPPITDPDKIIGFGLNYREHVIESGQPIPQHPSVFLRLANTLVGHGAPLIVPRLSAQLDYEVELAIVIGKAGRHVPAADALNYVAGYSCYNEGSVREYQGHNRQFGLGKNFEQSGSFGPWLMTADEFGDPAQHRIITRVNGIERQNATTDLMVFDVPQLINYLSQGYFLRPGDVIVSGSPGSLPPHKGETPPPDDGGVYVPGMVQMKPGDTCEVEISGLGTLRNPVAADTPAKYQTSLHTPAKVLA